MAEHSFSNPECNCCAATALPTLHLPSDHQHYAEHKRQRRHRFSQRRQLEDTVLYLRRQAGDTKKQLQQTKNSLTTIYSRKLETLDYKNWKKQQKDLSKQNLQHRKNLSSLSRYLNQIKKEQAYQQLTQHKKSMSKKIRSDIKSIQESKKRSKQQQLYELHARNLQMTAQQKHRINVARSRSLENKRKQSRVVRNELIQIESQLLNQDTELISKLQEEQTKLIEKLQADKEKQQQMDNMKSEIEHMDYEQFSDRLHRLERHKAISPQLILSVSRDRNM